MLNQCRCKAEKLSCAHWSDALLWESQLADYSAKAQDMLQGGEGGGGVCSLESSRNGFLFQGHIN